MTTRAPVAFFIFRRPETTERVWARIREAEPKRLYLCADAARPDREGEAERVAAARRIVETVDWECDVHRIYADRNMGCRDRVVSGLNEIFQTEERVIVLEDDCLPDLSFFRYCDELLDQYAGNDRVLAVCGFNPGAETLSLEESYSFSRNPACWGWATWKRAWRLYDDSMSCWSAPRRKDGILARNPELCRFLDRMVRATESKQVDSWANRWLLSALDNDALSCVPRVNLVRHLHSAAGATHVTEDIGIPAASLGFPLVHPQTIQRNVALDRIIAERVWDVLPFHRRVLRRLRMIFKGTTA
ncbi:MAG: hypothetical protein J6Y56_03620 [Fibrobacterales bacterium]|nr:hypothetical protein [Fibrobacterales bacterium]